MDNLYKGMSWRNEWINFEKIDRVFLEEGHKDSDVGSDSLVFYNLIIFLWWSIYSTWSFLMMFLTSQKRAVRGTE